MTASEFYVLEDHALVLRASKNPHSDVVDRLTMRVGQGITGWVAEHRQPRDHTRAEIQLISTMGFLVGAEIELARLEVENSELTERLETRKVVERAKGILQRDLGVTEEEAYLTIQRQSRQQRRSKREIAEALSDGALFAEIKGRGKARLAAQSHTMFSGFFGLGISFVVDSQGVPTHLLENARVRRLQVRSHQVAWVAAFGPLQRRSRQLGRWTTAPDTARKASLGDIATQHHCDTTALDFEISPLCGSKREFRTRCGIA